MMVTQICGKDTGNSTTPRSSSMASLEVQQISLQGIQTGLWKWILVSALDVTPLVKKKVAWYVQPSP